MTVISPFAHDLPRVVGRLTYLRWLMLLAGFVLCLIAGLAGVALPFSMLAQSLLSLALCNLLVLWRSRGGQAPAVWLGVGLLADVVCLTEVLAFTGGAANPLASLYLPPVLFAALLLPGRFAWALALTTLGAYALLFRWHLPWPSVGNDAAYAVSMHLFGMWVTFSLSAMLLTGFVSWLARRLAEREHALATARETLSRDEQLLAVGMQAAGAAHALSTPLNTLTLLVDDMLSCPPAAGNLADDLLMMRQQLNSCRQALVSLKEGADASLRPGLLFQTLADRLEGWRSMRPDVVLCWTPPACPDPQVVLDAAFWPAFFNLVNNAADAGGGEVDVSARFEAGVLCLDIINRQGHLDREQLARAGLTPLPSSKPAGMGIGVMLSHATLQRLGGSLELDNRPEGGVHARITLPVSMELQC